MKMLLNLVVLGLCSTLAKGQFKIRLISEKEQQEMVARFTSGIASVQAATDGLTIGVESVPIDRENDMIQLNETCDLLQGEGDYSLIVDLSWGGWMGLRDQAEEAGFPYLRLEATNHQFVQAADDYLKDRDAIDAALVFQSEIDLDQSLYFLIGNSYIRVIVINKDEPGAMERLAKMRPSPSYYIAYGTTPTLTSVFNEARARSLLKRDARWTFVFQDWKFEEFPLEDLDVQVTFFTMEGSDCCVVKNKPGDSCTCNEVKNPAIPFMEEGGKMVGETLKALKESGTNLSGVLNCYQSSEDKTKALAFQTKMTELLSASPLEYMADKKMLTFPLKFEVSARNASASYPMGDWNQMEGFVKASTYEHRELPRFFRIGTVPTTPWAYIKTDENGRVIKDAAGRPSLAGYCVDMVEQLSQKMHFDYELILPTDGSNSYGKKDENGQWNGVVGDLVNGEIDIAVAGMTMTSEREEVIDFVAPYFDQSGISIIIRKPVRARSLFKFMEVLRVEVWFAILAALIVTALMLWFLDRFSPYSAQNNKQAYPFPCRVFTLKESFWFALTSFTPQGGGEAPKSLSGRVLVAAYWLFVVLMLATFTANLAAFLTVERMQTTVQGLEELAQQSKINYTVVSDSAYFEYFKNMAGAEEDLYRVWKNLTLSSDADQSKYRVWDYPIKEQYTHIFKTIKASGLVSSPKEGFDKVLADQQGTFAFIHDAAEIRYEFYNNCNFTEVGEPFAEQPYAVAVQQGSHLQEEISKVILELQKDRYFESLSSKYWNSTLRSLCPTLDDSEGITLTSLGGVFIATLVGLGIAMVVLAFEVYFQRKQEKNEVMDISKDMSFKPKVGVIQVGSRQVHM